MGAFSDVPPTISDASLISSNIQWTSSNHNTLVHLFITCGICFRSRCESGWPWWVIRQRCPLYLTPMIFLPVSPSKIQYWMICLLYFYSYIIFRWLIWIDWTLTIRNCLWNESQSLRRSALQGRDIYIFCCFFYAEKFQIYVASWTWTMWQVIYWKESRVAHVQTPEGVDLLVRELALKILNVLSMNNEWGNAEKIVLRHWIVVVETKALSLYKYIRIHIYVSMHRLENIEETPKPRLSPRLSSRLSSRLLQFQERFPYKIHHQGGSEGK